MKRLTKRWIAFVASLYPRGWREEFGDEFDAVLDDVRPGWRVLANVLRGAVEMRVAEGTDWIKIAAATVAMGALVALGMSFTVAPNYVASAEVSIVPQVDPVRPTSPEVLQERAVAHLNEMETAILSRTELSAIINDPRLFLYKTELRRMSLEDVIQQMRRDIRIQVNVPVQSAAAPILLSISFSYPDRGKAQAAVRALANKFEEMTLATNRYNADAYRGFWRDMSAVEHAAPVPPPPVGEMAQVLDTANLPTRSVGPNRLVFLAWGLGGGLLVGLLAAFLMPRRGSAWRLARFAAVGCLLAGAVSFLLPDRYTSTGEMIIVPASITEDPLASLPGVTPATEFLRQMGPKVLGSEGLSAIVQDPRLNLYPEERSRKPIEEIVRNMRTDDLQIAAVNPTPGVASAFRISFSYRDRFKAQQTVWALMSKIDEANYMNRKPSQMSLRRRAIWQRKAGEVLAVLDTASLPINPVGPPRIAIAILGLTAGLLIGVVTLLWRRRPGTEILPPYSPNTSLPETS